MGMDLTKKRTSNEDSSNSPLSTNDSVVGMDGPGPGQPTTPSDQGTRRELFAYQQHPQGHTTDLKRFRQQSPPNNNFMNNTHRNDYPRPNYGQFNQSPYYRDRQSQMLNRPEERRSFNNISNTYQQTPRYRSPGPIQRPFNSNPNYRNQTNPQSVKRRRFGKKGREGKGPTQSRRLHVTGVQDRSKL